MQELSELLEKIALEGGEEFILCRDNPHAKSVRVTAFNIRRKMPKELQEDIGIQQHKEEGKYFVRIFKRSASDLPRFVRGNDGKLKAVEETRSNEAERIADLMRKDGKSEEEIKEALK